MSKVIAIDFGTINSRAAVMLGGSPVVIPSADGEGSTPTCVAFTESDEVLVGKAARRQALTNVENTIFGFKRLLGRRHDESAVAQLRRSLPYKVVEGENGSAWVLARRRAYSPEELSACVLTSMKQAAESFLGEAVSEAILTVPSHFGFLQRRALKRAARIAGLNVLRTIAEPTAAAVAYLADKKDDKRLAVCDFGGGNFGISIISGDSGVVQVHSTCGDALGGFDVDALIVDHLLKSSARFLAGDSIAIARLCQAAEQAKIDLSSATTAEISIRFIVPDKSGPKHLQTRVTRQQFNRVVSTLIRRSLECCAEAIEKTIRYDSVAKRRVGIKATDINEIVLIGGSGQIHLLREHVSGYFSSAKLVSASRRDEMVALGAAIQAGVLKGDKKDVLLLDVLPFSLGIETSGGFFLPIIERSTLIPTKKTEVAFNDGTIRIFEGDALATADNRLLGSFDLRATAPARHALSQTEVTFDVDAIGILHVRVRDQATGREQQVRISDSGSPSEDWRETVEAAPEMAVAGSASGICWFCQNRESNSLDAVTVKMHNNVTRLGNYVQWSKLEVIVPRCSQCKEVHDNVNSVTVISWLIGFAVAVAIVGVIFNNASPSGYHGPVLIPLSVRGWLLYSLPFIMIAAPIGLLASAIGRRYLLKGTRREETKASFRVVEDKIREGWAIGEKPN